jgi:hypothetical protein
MSRRTPLVRFCTLLLATLQIASPGVSAIADGRLALENASRPTTHVEATTTAACPVVHSPDCGVCRFLSSPVGSAPAATFSLESFSAVPAPVADVGRPRCVSVDLPDGRAPPAL